MTQATSKAGTETSAKKNRSGVVDYLSAPKKKRKNFIVLAFGQGFDPDLARAIGSFCRSQFPKHSIAMPKKKDELLRQATRNLSIIVIDDKFADLKDLLDSIGMIKERKSDNPVPVLFLTENHERLIAQYCKQLPNHAAVDDFLETPVASRPMIFSKLKYGIENKFSRRTRRFKMEIPVTFDVYGKKERIRGLLTDMSMHGGLLVAEDSHTFTVSDQIRVYLPLNIALKHEKEDIMRLQAKVRRIDISGNTVSFSWEIDSDRKKNILSRYLFAIFDKYLTKAGASMRAKVNKVPMPVGRPT